MAPRMHIVGAGLAGLSAAVSLAAKGHAVSLYEAAPQAGGRCRSYFDTGLGCRIDNGNHLLLAANTAALDYLAAIGAAATMVGPDAPRFAFCDVATGERWTLAPGPGRFPWWIFDAKRRVPGTRGTDYLRVAALRRARDNETVTDRLDAGATVFRRLWQPFAVAALNTEAEAASARLLWRVLSDSFGAGGAALRPLVPRDGLSESFVDPALEFLARHGGELRLGARLRSMGGEAGLARLLDFEDGPISLDSADTVILAVTAPVAARLLPGLVAPNEFRAIVNAHFRFEAGPEAPPFIGIVRGTAEWVFRKPGILSVTVSAADRLIDVPADELAELLWRDVARAYRLGAARPPSCRIVKEKRATFAATPAQLRRRPEAGTEWQNLFLAGDWTATGLPATIEGAIRSGCIAAALAHERATRPLTAKQLGATHSRGKVANSVSP